MFYGIGTKMIYYLGFVLELLILISIAPSMGQEEPPEIDVKCGRSSMSVRLNFKTPFRGIIYSKGFYGHKRCTYVDSSAGSGTGATDYDLTIPIDTCGTESDMSDPTPEKDMFYQNHLIIQHDPFFQGEGDLAKLLRCVWQHTFTRMLNSIVNVTNIVPVVLTEDTTANGNLGVSGFISLEGPDPELLITVQEVENFYAQVLDCELSSDRTSIPLIDSRGCLLQPDLMEPFRTEPSGPTITLRSKLKASNSLPSLSNSIVRCNVEICPEKCISACPNTKRIRRSTDPVMSLILINRN